MPWVPEDRKVTIHIIRQDYATALAEHKADPDREDLRVAVDEVVARRARAIRAVYREDMRFTHRQLAALFRVNKQVIREALEAGEDQ